ncbi:ATP-grasp domain-containing protein, partial [Trichormus variabilis ARAD]
MKRVGVIGGGQLAWMMGGAANKLGVELIVQTPSSNDPAVSIAQDIVLANIDDAYATEILAQKSDVITFENEFVNLEALSLLEIQGVCFRPKLDALSPLLDKYHQRCYLKDLGLPVPQFYALENQENLISKIDGLGFPLVLKSRRHGYDGQGTFIIRDLATLEEKIDLNNKTNTTYLIEEFIPFERELAVIAARSVDGEIVIYPVVETQQEQQVCRRVIAPAHI